MSALSISRMTRFLSLCVLLVAGLMLGCQEGASTGGGKDGKPSILLISVDGLIPSELSAFGGEIPTPALEALVSSGASWPKAHSVAPMTRPAVASLLTGLAPDQHGVRDDLFVALDEGVPTLAERLAERGYRTSAFPDSAYLVEGSGLWRGFELVNDPPTVRIDPARWFPRVTGATELAGAFGQWAASTQPDESWLTWVHLSYPLVGQMKQIVALEVDEEEVDRVADEYANFMKQFDEQLAAILEALEATGRGEQTAIFLVGTQGDQRGGETGSPGPGYSLQDHAVTVPIIAVLPGAEQLGRDAGSTPSILDVTATILEIAGAEALGDGDGVSLTEMVAADRPLFSWSWAQHDQLGWQPLIRVDQGGKSGIRGTGSGVVEPALGELMDGRQTVARLEMPMDQVQPFLDEFNISPSPIPATGIVMDDPAARREISQLVWRGRGQYQVPNVQRAGGILASISRKRDETNVTSYLDRGQAGALSGLGRASQLMEKAIVLRPQDPDLWHWYAHSIWAKDWATSERILQVVEPHVTNKGDILYDLACTRSLAEDLDRSAEYLEAAWIAGYRDGNHMETDPDLRNLRESGKYSEVMRRLQ